MYKKYPIIFMVLLLSSIFFACEQAATACDTSLDDMESWTYTIQVGSINGSQTQFDSYLFTFLSESQWGNIVGSITPDDGASNESWYTIVTWLYMNNFPDEQIRDFKVKLASDERATFFYINQNYYYRWVRVVRE